MKEMKDPRQPRWDIIIDELVGYGVVNKKIVEKCDCQDGEHHEMVRFSDRFISCMADSYNTIIEKADQHPDIIAEYNASHKGGVKITDIKAIMIVALVKYFGSNGKGLGKQALEEYAFVLSAVPKEALKDIEMIVKKEAGRRNEN